MRRGNLTTNLFIRLLLQDPEIVKSECIFLLGNMRQKASGVLDFGCWESYQIVIFKVKKEPFIYVLFFLIGKVFWYPFCI